MTETKNYREIDGDFIDLVKSGKYHISCHGANCFSIMGAGIAKQISYHFPGVYNADNECNLSPIQKLSNFTYGYSVNYGYICNLYTQYNPGKNFDYDAFILCLRKLKLNFPNKDNEGKRWKILFPLIGCGIGGGEWNKVKNIILTELADYFDITVVRYKKKDE